MGYDNPIAQRVALVHDLWLEFVEQPQARLLQILATAAERSVVDGFIVMECDERFGRLPDLFIRMQSPFERGDDYGARLVAELSTQLAPPKPPELEAQGAGGGEGGQHGQHEPNAGNAAHPANTEKPRDEAPQVPVLNWTPPPVQRNEADTTYVARVMDAFAAVAVPKALLGVVLQPGHGTDSHRYQRWLQALLPQLSERVRFFVVEDTEHGLLAPWPSAEAHLVMVRNANLDMDSAMAEVSAQVGDQDTPAGQFRGAYLELTQLLSGENTALVKQKAGALCTFAEGLGWQHMVVPVHFLLAAALLKAKDYAGCLRAYEDAEAAANRGVQLAEAVLADGPSGVDLDSNPSPAGPSAGAAAAQGKPAAEVDNDPAAPDAAPATKTEPVKGLVLPDGEKLAAEAMVTACNGLRLPARMAQGSVMIAAGDYIRAAVFYENAVPLAEELGMPPDVLDCQRLASFCYLQADEPDKAWRVGLKGVTTARAVADDIIASTTLPFLGDHLLRMTEQMVAYREHGRPLMKELSARLGPDWRPKPPA